MTLRFQKVRNKIATLRNKKICKIFVAGVIFGYIATPSVAFAADGIPFMPDDINYDFEWAIPEESISCDGGMLAICTEVLTKCKAELPKIPMQLKMMGVTKPIIIIGTTAFIGGCCIGYAANKTVKRRVY